ncbi:Membrane associated serine protease, rhomboid family [Microbacterium azadirachtae]|uniref:Membrane associated serine protease, rhomboid family n=1 Tax=Microbacterium azadirachtae TaxID=582680 RepID=A0A1I6HN68_9MICO|nr:rhomboid family intramembrane serine protease [Microbacterium azadirachtae]SFR55874.1 Membrane associated serine protease, rhomboid family [Microbacterium azadirachtae]
MTTPEFHANPDNFCYRHPGRQSFVLCQRCMRTICPECQTQAPVGVICPECMQDQRRSQTPAQRRANRRWGARSMTAVGGRPLVTYWILGITSVVSLLQMVPGIGGPITLALQFAGAYLYPHLSGLPFEPWRMLTVLLVHGGFLHLGLNMLALWMLGQQLEPLLGRAKFLTLYLVSGLGGSVAMALIAPGQPTVGASGAIFGLMAALLIIGRHLGANVVGILVILVINFAWGFFVGGIAWEAHLGGIVVGALVALIYINASRRGNARFWWIGLVAALVLVLLVVVAVVPPLLITAGR